MLSNGTFLVDALFLFQGSVVHCCGDYDRLQPQDDHRSCVSVVLCTHVTHISVNALIGRDNVDEVGCVE